jgi:hypothetical protein
MHYKGTGQMHSFRGLLADGAQDKIRIEGATGEIAWRITKFNIFPNGPGLSTQESLVKIYREEQTAIDQNAYVDFTEDELLAAAYFVQYGLVAQGQSSLIVTFDNALFVRNIWVTHTDNDSAVACNYYIELEEVKVSAAGMAQLAVAAARRT